MLESVVIVGGGCFGLSTAVSLAEGKYRGHADKITVIDRCATPPSLDAASSDYNKIVRQDYSDETWARFASTAIQKWSTPEYSPFFSQSGIIIMSSSSHPAASYIHKSLSIQSGPGMASDGRTALPLPTPADIKREFRNAQLPLAGFEGEVAYANPQSGWADARGAMDHVCRKARELGVRIRQGEVARLMVGEKGGRRDVIGVELRGSANSSGAEQVLADKVIVAAGSWSAGLVPELGNELLATGHSVAHIQLSAEEAKLYAGVPVVFIMDTGFYVFPPNKDNIVKFAIHGPGYVNPSTCYTGSTVPSLPVCPDTLPAEAIAELKDGLRRVYPALLGKEWLETRMCWYCDSPSSDWLLDYHPDLPSLFLATGDSGHAFKFLPIIGDMIVSALERTLPKPFDTLFTWENLLNQKGDPSRGGVATFARKTLESAKNEDKGAEMVTRVENEEVNIAYKA